MSNQRDEDFDSIYASIDDDDDIEELYVDVSASTSQTSFHSGPSPYVYPSARLPAIPLSQRQPPPLPPKSTIEAASKPPWPRPAPKPPANQASIKANTVPQSADPNRNAPYPLPRTGTVKASNTGYSPPSTFSRQGGYSRRKAGTPIAKGYQDMKGRGLPSMLNEEEQLYTHKLAPGKLENPLPPDIAPPPPPPNRTVNEQESTNGHSSPKSGYTLNAPSVDEEEYELLRPDKQRLRRGYGQQSRRSRQYPTDRIALEDLTRDTDERISDHRRRSREEKEKLGEVINKSENSKVVCILLTIIVVALLISLLSLAMSLYTLTRFELFLRSNDTISECDIKVTNCTTDVSNLLCQPVSGGENCTCYPKSRYGSEVELQCDIAEANCN